MRSELCLNFLRVFFAALGCVALVCGVAISQSAHAEEQGYLGVELQDVTTEQAKEWGLAASRGARVLKPRAGSPAERAGLKPNDVILEMDGTTIDGTAGLINYVQRRSPGTSVKIVIRRDRERKEIAATIGSFPEAILLTQQIDTLASKKSHSEAIPLAKRLVELTRIDPGPASADHALALYRLGIQLEGANQSIDAEAQYLGALKILEVSGANDNSLVLMTSRIGNIYYNQSLYTEAERFYRRSLATAQSLFGQDDIASSQPLSDLGDALRKQKRYAECDPFYRRAIAIRESAQGLDHDDLTWPISRLADALYYQNRLSEAEQLYRRVLSIKEKSFGADHIQAAKPLNDLGDTLRASGRYAEAELVYRRAAIIRQDRLGPEHPDLGETLLSLATTLRVSANFAEAEKIARQVLPIYEKAYGIDSRDYAWATYELATSVRYQSRYDEALPLFRSALAIIELTRGPEHSDVAAPVFAVAHTLAAMGRFAEAEPYARRALKINEGSGDASEVEIGRDLEMVGYILVQQDRVAEAESLYRRALAIRKQHLPPNHPELADSLDGLAEVLYWLNRLDEAEPLYREACDIRKSAFGSEHEYTAYCLNNIAHIMRWTNRVQEAEPVARDALAIRERTLGPEHIHTATSLGTLAAILEDLGRVGEAELLVQRAFNIREKTWGPDHSLLALSHNKLGRFAEQGERLEEALVHYRQASRIVAKSTTETMTRHRSRDDEAQRTRWVFRNLIDVAWKIADGDPARKDELIKETLLAAQWHNRTATSASLSQMAARFGAQDHNMAGLIRKEQDLRERWDTLERELLRNAGLSGEARDSPAVANVRTEFEAIESRLDQINAEIAIAYPRYADLANPQPLTVTELQQLLAGDEVLAFFFHTGPDTYLWFVSHDTARWTRLGLGRTYLTNTIEKLRCGLDHSAWSGARLERCQDLLPGATGADVESGRAPLPFDLSTAHELYNDLFQLVDPLIEGKHLFIVPSGPLTTLPFSVLVTKGWTGDVDIPSVRLRDVSWLGLRQPITVLPSIASFNALRRIARPTLARAPFAGFGNPLLEGDSTRKADKLRSVIAEKKQNCADVVFMREFKAKTDTFEQEQPPPASPVSLGGGASVVDIRRLAPVPETADLVCDVANYLRATEDDVFLGARASESQIKALSSSGRLSSYKVLSLATHGVVAGEVEGSVEPGLIFTPPAVPSDVDDGYLSASEVANLKFDADWVILSACNTAAGGSQGAEALSGLARAFFYAGARALLVSHWSVYEQAAVKLVTKAFDEMEADASIGRAEALRRSMAYLVVSGRDYESHPAYWAPFAVVGEGAAGR